MKPDVGERGVGVRWAQGPADLEAYLAREAGAVVLQQAHDGPFEVGLFYIRHPDAPRGHLFSITDKRFPVVTGDGRASVAELIERHPRYRLQADVFLARLADVDRVPAAGETVRLGRAGNHCQGTEFRDGRHLHTPALEAAIESIARHIDGFHFGRFDVRYASHEALARGEGFAIVELNGVTSEATHIYDPDALAPRRLADADDAVVAGVRDRRGEPRARASAGRPAAPARASSPATGAAARRIACPIRRTRDTMAAGPRHEPDLRPPAGAAAGRVVVGSAARDATVVRTQFRTQTTLVLVDVVVRDAYRRHGRRSRRSDFTVFEDGVRTDDRGVRTEWRRRPIRPTCHPASPTAGRIRHARSRSR